MGNYCVKLNWVANGAKKTKNMARKKDSNETVWTYNYREVCKDEILCLDSKLSAVLSFQYM